MDDFHSFNVAETKRDIMRREGVRHIDYVYVSCAVAGVNTSLGPNFERAHGDG